jgi:hypothetical protein
MSFKYVDESNLFDIEDLIRKKLKPSLKEDGYFYCPVLGICNIEKAFSQRLEAERMEHEAFDAMHNADGIVDKSTSPSKL